MSRLLHLRAFLASTWTRRALREESGSALLEVSLTMLLLMTVILTIISCSLVAFASHYVAYAAQQGARYAMVRGSTFGATACSTPSTYACQATAANVQNFIISHVPPGIRSSHLAVTTVWPGTSGTPLACLPTAPVNSTGCEVQVSVSYTFVPALPLLQNLQLAMSSTAVLPIQQ